MALAKKATLLAGWFLILLQPACHNFGSPNYELRVTLGSGITGTPATGTYSYAEFAVIDYSYAAATGMAYPTLTINGTSISSLTGEITMYNDVTIDVKQKDIRGRWHFEMVKDEEIIDEWDATIAGGSETGGTFLIEGRNTQGNWLVSGTDGNTLTITFLNWGNYSITGKISLMNGQWTGAGNSGTWSAVAR